MSTSVIATVLSGASTSTGASATNISTGNEALTPLKPAFPRMFNKIVITLENSLIPENKLSATPSRGDGLDPETEKDLRILGCELIQTAGILLKLPQVAMATGQVIFQRFFYSKSFVRHNMETVAMSCVCLASKIEEAPRRIRDVINVFHHIKQVRGQKDIAPMILDQFYTNLKTQVIKAERRVLKELGFCVHVKHPHKLIVMYLQVLKYEKHEQLMQMAWNFMNDSLRTDVFMRYQPEVIACACIYLSARKLGIPLPNNPPWFGIFRVSEDDIVDISYRISELYVRAKTNVEKLEASVEELKKLYLESRTKNKEQNTPPAVTTIDRNNGSHNAWGGFIQRAVPLPLPTEKSPDKDSRSRSRSRTRSPKFNSRSRSHSRSVSPGTNDYKGRSKKSHRSRSRTRSPPYSKSKKKSRHYSRSPSSSPHAKHRKRKSREHDRSDYYMKERLSSNEKYRDRDKYQERESRSSHHSSNKHHRGYSHRGSTHRGAHKHRDHDHSRDRKSEERIIYRMQRGTNDYESHSEKSYRSRSRTRSPPHSKSKKKSRHYSRSLSNSPQGIHRKRKSSREHDRSDYYEKERLSSNEKYRDKDKYQERESRSSHHSPSNEHYRGYSHQASTHKHRSSDHDHPRDRKR